MTGSEIRSRFLKYFEEHGHRVVKSSPLLPKDDPSLLFTNAGMVQFKRVFTGDEQRDYPRAASSQKCVRAGGKHNDLDNVGFTARHHTFFEMLGNFSFGDYFKRDAIQMAWELLTEGYGLPADKLYATVYRDDDEAFDLWRTVVGLPEERVSRLGDEDNFWAMGDTGPCGPCSEVLIDQGPEMGCDRPDCAPGCDCDRYLELWNLVFMQFNRDETGKLTPLPKPSIDTGLGLERLTAVLQGKRTNFDSDLFSHIMQAIGERSGRTYGADHKEDICFRVIADHARATAFLISDGILPSNEGRGYVLRRIMRRAIRFGSKLGMHDPFLSDIAMAVMDSMSGAYPELLPSKEFVSKIVQGEEKRFFQTLENGLSLLYGEIAKLQGEAKVLAGDVAFRLYDTFGFPLDVLNDVGREEGFSVDMDAFHAAMEKQREMSRKSWKGSGELEIPEVYRALLGQGVATEFVGYDHGACSARVEALVMDGKAVERASAGDEVEILLDRTPLYGEAGGQVGDRGMIRSSQVEIEILDSSKHAGQLIVHRGRVDKGEIHKGDSVEAVTDSERRMRTARNHTATHLLHSALRSLVGDHVKQAGSLVSPERLRFDFAHFEALDNKVLEAVEDLVNEGIRKDDPVTTVETDMEQAVESGAMALFEERYGDRVRMVTVGEASVELCGGTHVRRTGEIGFFKILSESSVAAGVRRIEAVTGSDALLVVRRMEHDLREAASLVKARPEELKSRIEKLLANQKKLEKDLHAARMGGAVDVLGEVLQQVKKVNGIPVVGAQVELSDPKELRDLGDRVRDRLKSGVAVLGAVSDGKAILLALVTKDLTDRLHAGKIIGKVVAKVGGKGGGRPDMAQAGGPQGERLAEALDGVYTAVEESL